MSEVDIAVDIIVLCVVGVELEDIVEEEVVQEFVAVDIAGDIVVLGATKGVDVEDIEDSNEEVLVVELEDEDAPKESVDGYIVVFSADDFKEEAIEEVVV